MSHRKRHVIALLSLVVCFAVGMGPAKPGSAHANLVDSSPAAGSALVDFPAEISLQFSEAVDPTLSSASLVASDGTLVASGQIEGDVANRSLLRVPILDPPLSAPGVYTLIWGAYSAEDGHASSGSFTFSVGTGESPIQTAAGINDPSNGSIVGKWLELIGLVLLSGIVFFLLTSRVTTFEATARALPVIRVLAVLGLSGALVSFGAHAVDIAEGGSLSAVQRDTVTELFRSLYGQAWLVRITALIIALLATRRFGGGVSRVRLGITLAAGCTGLVSIAISGHAGAVDRRWLAVFVDALHMSAASVWLGGLLGLLLVLATGMTEANERALLREQGNRFALAVILVVLAGVVSASWHIGGRRSLQLTDYGRTLLIKVAIVAVILGVAFYGRGVLQGEYWRPRWIPIAIGLELLLALVVLLFSADLSQTPPANQPLVVDVAARAIELNEVALLARRP